MLKDSTIATLGDWYHIMGDLFNSPLMEQLIKNINYVYTSGKVCYPKPENIFKAFGETPFSSLKVVILGQDPYYEGTATGVAYATNSKIIPPSLQKIREAVIKEIPERRDFDYTLKRWTSQGVLLLNSALTVEKELASSHIKMWNPFIKYVVYFIAVNKPNTIFAGTGQYACNILKELNIQNAIFLEHPAASCYANREWNSNGFFKQTSNLIKW
jgi:uracil-DNA glycosylase